MLECDVRLTFTIAGPYLSRSSTSGGYGIDAVPLRDPTGRPLLPGSHVRGRIREALADLWQLTQENSAPADEWLGPDTARDNIESDHGLRKFGWHFGDFLGPQPAANAGPTATLTRIALDDETGSVKSGAMQVIEPAVPLGAEGKFTGTVSVSAETAAELDDAICWLRAGAAAVPSLGSFRNVGFGRVKSVSHEIVALRSWNGPIQFAQQAAACPRPPSPNPAARPPVRLLRVKMEEPFCVGGKRRDRNTIQSLRHLPGAVLKGAVAHLLQKIHGLDHRVDLAAAKVTGRWELVCRNFSGIRFCAAWACEHHGIDGTNESHDSPDSHSSHTRPLVAPLSLFKAGKDDRVRDAALLDGPFLVKHPESDKFIAPAFAPDWKNESTPGWDIGPAEPDVELRIRTAIDSQARRVRDEHLFAMELVRPGNLDWLGTISLEGLSLSDDEKCRLWDDLEALLKIAVLRIGKTKARATFSLEDRLDDPNLRSSPEPVNGRWIVVLQSPALLVDPKALHDEWAKGVDATERLYRETFATLSAALELKNHFADQQLHGGFLAVRGTPGSIPAPQDYAPLLVTDARSVFVLEAVEGKTGEAKTAIEQWLKTGLPLPRWAVDRYGEDYKINPFLPCDGFGEIAVNVPLQMQLADAAANSQEIKTL